MKINCDGLSLSEATLKVIKASGNRAVNPVLEGIKLTAKNDELILFATDKELSIEKRIKAVVMEDGEVVVPGRLFSEFVKSLTNEEIEMSVNENNVIKIKYSDNEAEFNCLELEDYPKPRQLKEENVIQIKGKSLKNLIQKTAFCAASDDARPILKGCLFEKENGKLRAVCLDGYRMGIAEEPTGSEGRDCKIVVPVKSLNEIFKFIEEEEVDVFMMIENNFMMINFGTATIMTTLLTGDFINYRQILPAHTETKVTVKKDGFDRALERANLLSRADKSNYVLFEIEEKTITISAKSELGTVTECLPMAMDGKDLDIKFNVRYVYEAIKAINSDYIDISLNGSVNPCIIEANDNKSCLYLILPVRKCN